MPIPLIDRPGTLEPVLRLALPVLVEQLLVMMVGFSDTVIAGLYLEDAHLAAMGLMSYLLLFLNGLTLAVGIGATAMVARFVGGRNETAARHVVNQAFLLGALLAIAVTAIGYWFGHDLIRAMQLSGRAGLLAERYLRLLLPALPLMFLQWIGIHCLRGAGQMLTGLAVMAVVNVVNIVLSWGLVLGAGPLPKLGWDGLAIGTALGESTGGLIVLACFISRRSALRLAPRLLVPQADLIRRLLRIGLPGGSDVVAVITCHMIFLSIINHLGELAAAAHGVAVRIESLSYLPGSAFQVAAATLAGQFLGARQPRRAGRSVLTACLVGGGMMVAAGFVFYFHADGLTHLLLRGDQTDVAELAAPLLRVVAFSQPALALAMILTGALRGAGDTRWPLLFTFLGMVCVRIPGAYCLTHVWSLGVIGGWYAMVADLYVRCALVLYRFWHGGWKRIEI